MADQDQDAVRTPRDITIDDALRDVRRLFQCALTENRIPKENIEAVTSAFVAVNGKTAPLSSDDEKKLWDLYSDLVRYVQPATVSGLQTASELEADERRRPGPMRLWHRDPEVRRAIRCAWVIMGITLFLVIILQIYSLVGSKTLQELEKATAALEQVRREENQVRATNAEASEDALPLKEILERKIAALNRVSANNWMIDGWNGVWQKPLSLGRQLLQGAPITMPEDDGLRDIANQQYGLAALQAVALYLLPLLYGLLGASVFVLRRIGSELEASSFTRTNSYRYRLRYALGAVLGATAGLIFTPTDGGAPQSPAQLATFAFLAGFSVEAVFSQMDALITAWRKKSSDELARTSGPAAPSKPAGT